MTHSSPLPAFIQRAQPTSSAVVLNYTLLGKKKDRGEGRLTIKIGLNRLDSQQTSLVFSPHMCQECQTSRLW